MESATRASHGRRNPWLSARVFAGILLLGVVPVWADDLAEGKMLLEEGRHEEAVKRLRRHAEVYPEQVETYRHLATALEALGRWKEAAAEWDNLAALAETDEHRAAAAAGIQRCRAGTAAPGGASSGGGSGVPDAEKIARLARVEEAWTTVETSHLTVKAHNKELAQFVGDRAELDLARLCKTFLGGAAWPHKVPLTIYRDHNQYVAAGNPAWSGGGTTVGYASMEDFLQSRKVRQIDLFQLLPDGTLNPELIKPKVLPHELTHLVLSEFFGDRPAPLWFNEGIAQFMESGTRQERDEFVSDMAIRKRDALISLEDLLRLPGYPNGDDAKYLFYAESSSFLGYLADTQSPEKLHEFIEELKKGTSGPDALGRLFAVRHPEFLSRLEDLWLRAVLQRFERR